MRYEARIQKWNEAYHYDAGYAVWDTALNKPVGWSLYRDRAEGRVAELNADPLEPAPEDAEVVHA